MTLGDVDGNGALDIVLTVQISHLERNAFRVYAISAMNGSDVDHFPKHFDMGSTASNISKKQDTADTLLIPSPLLVDLHTNQLPWLDRIRMNQRLTSNLLKGKGITMDQWRGNGVHIIQPFQSNLHIIEGISGCIQVIHIGDGITSMVQVDDVSGTGTLDLIVTTTTGEILTLDVPDHIPFHPLNVRSRPGVPVHGFSASSGIFVHEQSRVYRQVLGMPLLVTFEFFNVVYQVKQEHQQYKVEMRLGTSGQRSIFQKIYDKPGIYTEEVYIPYSPGYYTVSVRLRTMHGLVHYDIFHFGHNVNYADNLFWLAILPFFAAAILLLLCINTTDTIQHSDTQLPTQIGGTT